MKWEHFKRLRWITYKEPVLVPGKYNAWDNYAVITPSVFANVDKFLMFYTGQGYETKDWGIGIAVSSDLIHWEKSFQRPIISAKQSNDISSLDGAALIFNGRYYLFFESKARGSRIRNIKGKIVPRWIRRYLIVIKWRFNDWCGISMALKHASGRKIWCMDSDSLVSWDINRARVTFEPSGSGWDCDGVFSPRVFRFKDKFYLLYGGSNGEKICTGLAISSDLYNWERISSEPILRCGGNGDFDENHALMVDIFELEDGYVGFYEGEDKYNRYRIGIAYSKDLFNWEKFSGNPIMDIGGKGGFDERGVCAPHIIVKNQKYFLFYSGHNRYMQGCCGLAIGEM